MIDADGMSHHYERYSAGLSREAALVCKVDGLIRWADRRAERLLGACPGESLLNLTAEGSRDKCARFLINASVRRAPGWEITFMTQGDPVIFDCVGIPYRHDIMVVATQMPSAHSSVIGDMNAAMGELSRLQRETQQQQRELGELASRLAQEREFLREILEKLPLGVRVSDIHSGEPIQANTRLQELFSEGLVNSLEDMEGRPYAPEEYPLARTIATGQSVTDEECQIIDADGGHRVVSVSSVPIRGQSGSLVAAVEVYHDITTLKRLQRELEHASLHDPLTGLPNRRLFLDRLNHLLRTAGRRRTQVALMFLDLDDFKEINDTFGHHVGDDVLRVIGARLESLIRVNDAVARLAGDEFVVLLDDISDSTAVLTVANRILDHIRRPVRVGGLELRQSVSVGSVLSGGTESAEQLLQRADQAMYTAKRTGKNRFVLFENRDEPPDDPAGASTR